MEESQLLSLVNRQYQESYDASSVKRQTLRDRQKYYMNTAKSDPDKISLYMIRWYVNTLISLYYEDWLQSKFYSRDLYSYLEAENINSVAEADYNLMKMDSSDYIIQFNRLIYWVWVRVFTWRDTDLKCPIFESINPMSIYPDPRWHTQINNFRYFWFERNVSLASLESMWYNYIWDIHALLSSEEELNIRYMWLNKWIYPNTEMNWISPELKKAYKDNSTTTVYYHYLIIDWKCHQVVVRNKRYVLSDKIIKPLADDAYAQKIMKFPIALNYYEPIEWDPWWTSLFDVLEDKQKLKTLFMNLMRIKATKEALWWQMFIDREIFMDNKTQLSRPTKWRQYLPVRSWWQPIGNSVFSVPEPQISADVYNLQASLDKEAESDSWISNSVRWISSSWTETATEVKNRQMNSNVNLVLWNKINWRWERDFRSCWFYWYKYYFKESDEKLITSNRSLMNTWKVFKRKNLFCWVDPSLEILNKGMMETKRKEEAQSFLNTVWMHLQVPTMPPISKRFLQRKAFRLQWMETDEIEIAVPYTPEEMDAKIHVLLLNKNIPIEVWSLEEDHYTYMVIYNWAMDTPAKFSAIEARKQAYIQSWQQQQLMQQQSQQTSLSWSWSMANAEVSRQSWWVPSNLDI